MKKKILYFVILALFAMPLLNIALGELKSCMKCEIMQCKGVGYETCGRIVICTGHCYRGTAITSQSLCVKGDQSDKCQALGTMGCGEREASDCSGWPSCIICDDYHNTGLPILVLFC